VAACRPWIQAEVALLAPRLVLPVGALAIAEVLGHEGPLKDVIGSKRRATFHGQEVDVIALPHPSGASTWHRTEPGKSLLARALKLVAAHEAMRAALTSSS
jgi:uracil-DNA glycosylase